MNNRYWHGVQMIDIDQGVDKPMVACSMGDEQFVAKSVYYLDRYHQTQYGYHWYSIYRRPIRAGDRWGFVWIVGGRTRQEALERARKKWSIPVRDLCLAERLQPDDV